MGLQRVRYDWVTEYFYDTFIKVSKLDEQSFKNSIRITTKSLDLGMSQIWFQLHPVGHL